MGVHRLFETRQLLEHFAGDGYVVLRLAPGESTVEAERVVLAPLVDNNILRFAARTVSIQAKAPLWVRVYIGATGGEPLFDPLQELPGGLDILGDCSRQRL